MAENVRAFLDRTKSMRVSRGLPSSRKLHSLEIRRANIVAMRDWYDTKREKAEAAVSHPSKLQEALAGIFAFGRKFRPWLKRK